MASLLYVTILMGALSSVFTFYCCWMSVLLAKALKRALPTMRNQQLWQVERDRQREDRRRRAQEIVGEAEFDQLEQDEELQQRAVDFFMEARERARLR